MLTHLKANISDLNAIAIFCTGRSYPSYHLQEHAVGFVASRKNRQLLADLLTSSDKDSVIEQLLILRGLSTNTSLKEVHICPCACFHEHSDRSLRCTSKEFKKKF